VVGLECVVRVDGFDFRVGSVELVFADGSREGCVLSEVVGDRYVFKCVSGSVSIYVDGGLVGIEVSSVKLLNSQFFAEVVLGLSVDRALALTLHPGAGSIYSPAFRYFNPLAIDREPTSPKPEDNPEYPPKFDVLTHEAFAKRFPCWTYPVVASPEAIPSYTIFVLAKANSSYIAMLALSNGDATAYIEPGFKIKLFLGKERYSVRKSWVLSISMSSNPYEAIKKCVEYASKRNIFKMRIDKKTPIFIDRFGWCSWNALLTEDLSHENIVRIVKGLKDRGVPINWIIIDDGWQNEVRKGEEWFVRVLKDLSASNRFPKGLKGVVDDVKELGVKHVGLWHTINIHWGGFEEDVSRKLGVEGYRYPLTKTYVPPPQIEKAIEFYKEFYRWVKENGFSFIKVDNQWVIHALYWGESTVGEAARNIQIALQVGATINGLEILNCMSMAPEDYSNYFLSNAMRVSMDYIPFWKGDAKLHTIFSVYNSLFFSHIAYPDYDMWISYDPYAKIHAVARVFSGGPIYITDRHPEKTDVELIKRFVLENGEITRVDEPGLPTRDILLRDPYNEKTLLKVASRIRDTYLLALFNVNKEGAEISEDIPLDILPYELKHDRYAYYMVFSGRRGAVDRDGKIKIDLKELETEILVIAPIENGKAVIGLKEYMLPPYPLKVTKTKNRIYIELRAPGTLIYYTDGEFKEIASEKNQVIEI
jgi:hypothetical protein